MSKEFGDDLITISDEDGNDYVLEHFDTVEIDGVIYIACMTADKDEDDKDFGVVILEVVDDGEFVSIEDDELLQELYDIFMERLDEDDEDGFYDDDDDYEDDSGDYEDDFDDDDFDDDSGSDNGDDSNDG